MTPFQLVSFGLFLALAGAAYRKELLGLLQSLAIKPSSNKPETAIKPSIAVTIVSDLIAITELRDKLAAEDCPEGVDACTNLLRVIVEQTKPAKLAG